VGNRGTLCGSRDRRVRCRTSAYFDIFRIEEFANAISEYPLPERLRCSLASGFGPGAPEPLDQEQLSIEVYPIDSRGHIGVQVRMATLLWDDIRHDSQRTTTLELLTTYEPMAKFSRHLLAVLKGTAEEAIREAEMIP